jgi:hypothetical protein
VRGAVTPSTASAEQATIIYPPITPVRQGGRAE